MLWFTLTACSWFDVPVTIETTEPERLHSGATVAVHGTGFIAPLEVQLSGEGGSHPTSPLVDSPSLLHFEIPHIPPGTYTVTVTAGEQSASSTISIWPDPPETPCARGYSANTEISFSAEQTVITRFYPNGRQERIRTPFSQIQSVEYLPTASETGPSCSAIFLQKTDGTRLLFEDSTEPLEERARTLASYLKKRYVSEAPPPK